VVNSSCDNLICSIIFIDKYIKRDKKKPLPTVRASFIKIYFIKV